MDRPLPESTFAGADDWREGLTVSENWDIPMSEAFRIIKEQSGQTFSRYLACTVTLNFRRETATYKALWLFGTERDGKPLTLDIDTVVGISGAALHSLMDKTVYPSVILETKLWDVPAVREWFQANTAPDCGNAKRDVCCDPRTAQCGVASSDIQRSLALEVKDDEN